MRANDKRRFGRTSLEVTVLGFGAAPIGNIFHPIPNQEAYAMLTAAWDHGMRFFDTAPMYGHGLSEHRTGHELRNYPRDEYVLSTKVGRLLKPQHPDKLDTTPWVDCLPMEVVYDYSYDAVLRSIEDSLNRMGLYRIDIALIHDIDVFTHGPQAQPERFAQAMAGAYKGLLKLREEGVISAIGVGVNEWQVCHAALQQGDFDCFLLAGRYTLLEQEALDEFLPLCEQRNAAIILGGGYNSGILATGAVAGAKYNYNPAPAEIMTKTAAIEAVCQQYEVPLAAAALQFVVAHPCIPTNVPGTRTVVQLEQNVRLMEYPIPVELWQDLRRQGLIREDAPTP